MSESDLLTWGLVTARQHTLRLVAGVPPEQMSLQAAAGEPHPAWILGHLLLGDTYLLSLIRHSPLPDDYHELLQRYGPGAAPQAAAEGYHSKRELVARLTESGLKRVDQISRLPDAVLAQSLPDPELAQTQPTLGHHVQGLVFHEAYHAGQLAAWRRAHGFAAVRWVLAPKPKARAAG